MKHAQVDSVVIRLDDFIAMVNIKSWIHNSTAKRAKMDITNNNGSSLYYPLPPSHTDAIYTTFLNPAKRFYFPFVSATHLESKFETLQVHLSHQNRFPWTVATGTLNEDEKSSSGRTLLSFLLSPELLFYAIMLGVLQMQMWSTMAGSGDFMNVETDVQTRFSDVAGLDEAKLEVEEIV